MSIPIDRWVEIDLYPEFRYISKRQAASVPNTRSQLPNFRLKAADAIQT